MTDSLKYKVALTLIDGIGDTIAKNLISYTGGAEAVFKEKKQNLLKIPQIGPKLVAALAATDPLPRAEAEVEWADKHKVGIHYFLDEDYPARLRRLDDCPIVLYYKGTASLNHARTVAIVGTRNPTDYGLLQCEKLVEGLIPYDVQIISGLAYGVDSAAHNAAVQQRVETIAVMGTGLDRTYPAQNRKLASRMLEHGGLLSRFKTQSKPDRENFPMRNKIIAAMSDVVIVVQSKRSGGSIITAEFANAYHKDVFAIPGRVDDEASEGCNRLIKIHKANLLESAADVAYIMRWEELDHNQPIQSKLFVELEPLEEKVIAVLRDEKVIEIDMLCYRLSKTGSEMAGILLGLEFKGLIKGLPGKRYMLR